MNKTELNEQLDAVEKALNELGIEFTKADRTVNNKSLENELVRLEELLEGDENDLLDKDSINAGDQAREDFLNKREADFVQVEINKGINIETKQLGEKQVLESKNVYSLPSDFARDIVSAKLGSYLDGSE